jgi:MinD-like ATPase involved in chromosome partitioning or flagellar assembly
METITFYSYKGGVGRTLSLANIAVYLSRFGLNVCIVDFDLEAPGLIYKLKPFFSKSVERGLVDYIYEFTSGGNVPASLSEYALTAENVPEGEGNIRLIPAGNVLSAEYWKKLASIDWHGFFYESGGEGIPFFLEFKEKIRSELQPDFLLIDSRTGITEMSGICTALLPDKVVFLITNNPENIEGSRQILRGIQKAKRFKGQEPIEVSFALTRIPSPQNTEEIENERKIIESIRNFLNANTTNLEDRLNIFEISVLHSDRDLELSESLRLNRFEFREKSLTRDYLKLFSKIIPSEITESKINNVVERVITQERMLEEPDKVQEELEALADTYPSPQTYEKLINFYILRNTDTSKLLAAFGALFKVTHTLSEKMYQKLSQVFMGAGYYLIKEDILAKVEEYLRSKPDENKNTALKLADVYYDKNLYKRALTWYLSLVDTIENPVDILKKIFDIYGQDKIGTGADVLKMYGTYNSLVLEKTPLKIKALEALYKKGEMVEAKKLVDRIDFNEEPIFEYTSGLFFKIMKTLGRENALNERLSTELKNALVENSSDRVYELGKIYYKFGKAGEFRNAIPDGFPDREGILSRLERKYRH